MLRTLTSTPPDLLRAPPTLGLGPKPQYFTQTLDHFSNSTDRTWSQAFYVNDTFWVPGSDAPVFLCVGGEGPPLDGSVVVASPHCNNAVEWLPETKALMLAVEHRYYGEPRPLQPTRPCTVPRQPPIPQGPVSLLAAVSPHA